MLEEINRAQDDEMQTLAELLTTVKTMDKPLREKWLDYGAGLAEGYKLAKRHTETNKEANT